MKTITKPCLELHQASEIRGVPVICPDYSFEHIFSRKAEIYNSGRI